MQITILRTLASKSTGRSSAFCLTTFLCGFASKWLLAGMLASMPIVAATWQTEIKPVAGDNFTRAAFTLWLDQPTTVPVALLVIAPGWNGDGRNAVNDVRWQTFARKENLGLVGVYLQSNEHNDHVPPYHVATQGSGTAFLKAITRLANDAKQPRLARAPLIFWGHSAGGQFGYGMACLAPERVIGFAAIKGGVYLSEPLPATFGVPGIFIVGEQDNIERAMNITWLFERGRAKGAPWCLAYETGSGHELSRANDIVLPFFQAVLKLRVPAHQGKLRPIVPSENWIGIRSTLEVRPSSPSKETDLPRTVWLPDQITAKVWQDF